MYEIISEEAIHRRREWINRINTQEGDFESKANEISNEIDREIREDGVERLIEHLRLCGSIPEEYGRDTSVEKLYSKYTDILLSYSFRQFGFNSMVLSERSASADVEAISENYGFVADAKAFRLSRTAKNQKDFKIQAMDVWRRDLQYALVVAPIYHFPKNKSQIYSQAITRHVCILSFEHLALFVSYRNLYNGEVKELLRGLFELIETMNPNEYAYEYWSAINRYILTFSEHLRELWRIEKIASKDAVEIAKEIDLSYLARERHRIMSMSHEEALRELIKVHNIDKKLNLIQNFGQDNILLDLE